MYIYNNWPHKQLYLGIVQGIYVNNTVLKGSKAFLGQDHHVSGDAPRLVHKP